MNACRWILPLVVLATVNTTGVVLAADNIDSMTYTDNVLDTITLIRGGQAFTYTSGELVSNTVTAYGGQTTDTKSRLFLSEGTTTAPAAGSRASVLEDFCFETGFVNAASWSVSFATPVVNSYGPDLFLFDWGSGSATDAFQVTAPNSATKNYAASSFVSLAASRNAELFQSSGTANTLALLESAATTFSDSGGSSASVGAVGIDLSDFGYAQGQTVASLDFTDTSSTGGIDPLLIAGTPVLPGKIDDFQAYSVGTDLGSQPSWTTTASQFIAADPTNSENLVLDVSGDNCNIYHAISAPEGDVATLLMRFLVPTNDAPDPDNAPDISISLSDVAAPASGADGSSVFRIVGSSLQAYDNGTWKTLDTFEQDTWYTLTLEADTTTDSFQAFLEGGTFADKTLLNSGSDTEFAFRHGAGDNDLQNFFIRTNGGHATTDHVFVDDIHVWSVAVVVPEPGTAVLLIGLALLWPWFRRAKRTLG